MRNKTTTIYNRISRELQSLADKERQEREKENDMSVEKMRAAAAKKAAARNSEEQDLSVYTEDTIGDQPTDVQVAWYQWQNAQLKKRSSKSVSMKVSEKGGLSVYGLGRFPVTLYKEQWARLLAMADDISGFIKEHNGELKEKGGN